MKVRAEITNILGSATSDTNPVTIELASPHLGAFGDLIVAEKTPVVQIDFVYGIHPQLGTSTSTNSGSVTASDGLLVLQSSDNANGTATFFSVAPARYRPGQGITARFTTVFSSGVVASTQIAGMSDNGDGYFFGYNGTSFGILHKNRGVETWVPQASWNGDTCDGTGPSGFNWNKQTCNVLLIAYPY
jgi:hypothetical protein